jgi:hypothetical protein
MIQVITQRNCFESEKGIEVKKFSDHNNFNDYDLTIIDLNGSGVWSNYRFNTYNGSNTDNRLWLNNDFNTIRHQIALSDKKTLFLLPQNEYFLTGYSMGTASDSSIRKNKIKDSLRSVSEHIGVIDSMFGSVSLIYSPTSSIVNGEKMKSDFIIQNVNRWSIIKKNANNNSITAIKNNNVVRTTINCQGNYDLMNIAYDFGLILDKKEKKPEWMDEVAMFDDAEQAASIKQCEEEINNYKDQIKKSQEILKANDELKSILYTQSKELENTVIKIIGELFDCDLSGFEDEKKEDFRFQYGDSWYIGEIKGVTSNVKSENVSQLEVHYRSFLEENESVDPSNVYALLVMNHQRTKPVEEREPINIIQIALSQRNESLIIETSSLLKVLEKFRNGELTRDEVVCLLSDKKNGIIQI